MAIRTARHATGGRAWHSHRSSAKERASGGREPRYTGFGMPIYEYRCANEHRFEVMQRFSDEPLDSCEICGAPASRVLYPAAIHFKGSGFYSTDYGRRKRKAGEGDGKPAEAGASAESKPKETPKA